jgi:hypothetical protein
MYLGVVVVSGGGVVVSVGEQSGDWWRLVAMGESG